MSFIQAKELIERIELSEVTLKDTLDHIDKSTKKLDIALEKQKYVMKLLPNKDKKLDFLRLLVVLNVGFILGLLGSKVLF